MKRGGVQDELFSFVNFLGSFECFPNTHENVKFQPTFIGNYSLSIFSANKIRHKYDKIPTKTNIRGYFEMISAAGNFFVNFSGKNNKIF